MTYTKTELFNASIMAFFSSIQAEGGLISESFSLGQPGSPKQDAKSLLSIFLLDGTDSALIFGEVSQSETLSEIKLTLESTYGKTGFFCEVPPCLIW